ncbi:MAG TPA: GTPase Era [Deltaproteobacteria bacterium]|nr:GTPase Era [Deltaproteobacteria bacterium]
MNKPVAHDDRSDFKSGFVIIVGAPNVGKSTLLNRVLGEKISITSKKPQTTRNRILGVVHRPCSQMVFIDTPGIHRAENIFNIRIVGVALGAMGDADLILLMIDVTHPDPSSDAILLEALKKQNRPVILAVNKIDGVDKAKILEVIEEWAALYEFREVVPVSAKQGTQIDTLLEVMETALPHGPPYFPEDSITDIPERFIAAEMIREKVFRLTGQEIPYSIAVTVEVFSEDVNRGLVKIHASIHVERDSQKGIVIGNGGRKLKQIGEVARKDIERMLGSQVFLKLFVRVQKNWSKDTKALRQFGY